MIPRDDDRRDRRLGAKVPASACVICECPDWTNHHRRGTICAGCGATWAFYAVDTEGDPL